MVLCKYFLNGNCRFGAKCVNEHLDVKQLLKSDVESAVNGNQWPLSCFGPFKEKPSIPNFIEDQSFEEIRMLCYGSKKQNFFDSFNQQFTKEVFEAKNKLKMLLTLNKDVMDVVINLYNSSEPPKGAVQQNSNPFGLSSAANPQQSTNLFGNSTTTQTSMFGSSPFGGASNATTGNSLFGGAQKSILGQSAFSSFAGQTQPQQQPQQTSGMFGSLQPQQQQPQQQQTNSFGGNIFSQAAPQTPGGASIFGTTQQPQQQSQPFGATNTSAFGQPVNSGNIFAQAAQQTQQQPAVGGNIFAQAVQQPQQAQPPAFGMFSQAAQQAPPAFGAQMTTQSPFGAVQQQQQRPFFGQTQQQQQQQQQMQQQQQQQQQMQQQQQQQQQMQQQQQQQNPGNIFSTPMQKPQQQQQQPFQAQQPPSGIFASAVANSPFGPPAQPQQQQQQANIFAQAVAGFPQSQQQPLQQPMTSDRTYSKMENLRPEEIEAFQADTFELGKIPFSPPPRELVN